MEKLDLKGGRKWLVEIWRAMEAHPKVDGEAEVHAVEIDYDGCGDSGQIDRVMVQSAEGVEERAGAGVEDLCREFVLALLTERRGGWELDNGSWGSVLIRAGDPVIEVRHHVRSDWQDFFDCRPVKEEDVTDG